MDITLDKESFKALAADTRINILKILLKRQHLQTELAQELSMSIPTIKEHLDALVKAGLVERKEEGRKWKYYALSKNGKAILDPEQKRIFLVLSLFILSVVGGVAAYFRTMVDPLLNPQPLAMKAAPLLAESTSLAMDAGQATNATGVSSVSAVYVSPWGLILYLVWLSLLVIILGYCYFQRKKYLKA